MRVPENSIGLPETIWWDQGDLFLLDQTLLPHQVWGYHADTVDKVFDAIQSMKVRGAPAIGVAAAYGMLVDHPPLFAGSTKSMIQTLSDRRDYLVTARPTAVNLQWALDRMLSAAKEFAAKDSDIQPRQLFDQLETEAIVIHTEDREMCHAIGEHGKALITEGCGVLTHCNAGSLATSEFGTATSPMYAAHRDGVKFRAYADETRPRLQGARLTAWELQQSGIDTTLLCDNMAAALMAEGKVDLVLVGTDRVTADGSVANKIGTLGLAIVASHYNVPFYVAFPSSTFDPTLLTGGAIPIEHRGAEEVVRIGEEMIAADDVTVYSPAFDVTPPELVTGYITQHGLYRRDEMQLGSLQIAALVGGEDGVNR